MQQQQQQNEKANKSQTDFFEENKLQMFLFQKEKKTVRECQNSCIGIRNKHNHEKRNNETPWQQHWKSFQNWPKKKWRTWLRQISKGEIEKINVLPLKKTSSGTQELPSNFILHLKIKYYYDI